MNPASHYAIAIDGPAASGKSTIAKRLAQRLGIVMVNSGEMYRAVTWKVLHERIDPHDVEAVVAMLHETSLECGWEGISSTIKVDGLQLGEALRSPEVNSTVSLIAAIPAVRDRLLALQRDYLTRTNLIMEGRDIGSVVFPDTPFKVYIDADQAVRAARRVDMGEIDSVGARDLADSKRVTAPLLVAPGAVIVDTSALSIDQAVEKVLQVLVKQGLPNHMGGTGQGL